ncbi:hypothetical protein TRIUR3_09666 [Triticum urartu]|uniref:Uncharacterized protein n=1 Tax=Triticum urartu TaxID=4572 RepID=M7ZJR9_TRIUA|nr:hypothetical protein TRIUR3_09666 [Triticum urartu]
MKVADHDIIKNKISKWWMRVNLLTEFTIKKGILNIKLRPQQELCQQWSYGPHEQKSHHNDDHDPAEKATCHKTSFVQVMGRTQRKRNKIPYAGVLKSRNLLCHRKLPFGMNNCIMIRSWLKDNNVSETIGSTGRWGQRELDPIHQSEHGRKDPETESRYEDKRHATRVFRGIIYLPRSIGCDRWLSLMVSGVGGWGAGGIITRVGQEAAVQELADSIFARRIASTIEQKQVKIESEFLGEQGEQETEYSTYHQRLNYYDDDDDNKRVKKAKHIFRDDRGASSSHAVNQPTPWLSGGVGSAGDGYLKEEDYEMTSGPRANVRGDLAKPPFFLYGNVVNITKDAWSEISGFLSGVQPEFINSQLFSALMRREGYLHNLPTERRHVVVPKSPMTIEDAVPSARHYWPTWDTRKHIGSVTSEVAGIEQLCEMLGKTIKDSRGFLSEEKRAQILHQCKMANLIWIGQDRLGPLQPNQMERILGYPSNHTNLFGLNPPDRIGAMKYAFQTDTIAYLLSVLKDIYPDGLRVLSIYSGVGGAEIALHRLGIPLKCVVSVEESDVNRKILKRWWAKTEQSGVLRQLNGIWKLKTDALEDLFKEFGGFDLVVGGNYSSYRGGTTVNATMGMDSDLCAMLYGSFFMAKMEMSDQFELGFLSQMEYFTIFQ